MGRPLWDLYMRSGPRVRDVTTAAVDDVTPPALREQIQVAIDAAPATPGAVVYGCSGTDDCDRRVAGVQLIYAGLWTTRELIVTPPWETPPTETADLDVLAANTMVARGFELLAGTPAATQAVRTVQTFGRIQRGNTVPSKTLERDVLTLAVVAGSDEPASAELSAQLATLIEDSEDSMPQPAAVLDALDNGWTQTPQTGD